RGCRAGSSSCGPVCGVLRRVSPRACHGWRRPGTVRRGRDHRADRAGPAARGARRRLPRRAGRGRSGGTARGGGRLVTLRWRLLTPAGRPAALAAVAIEADSAAELDAWLELHGLSAGEGAALLRPLLD